MANLTNAYHDTLNLSRLGMTAGVAISNTQYTEFGRITCPAGTAYEIGFGDLKGLDNAEGRIFLDVETVTPTAFDGFIRIDVHDPQNRVKATVTQRRTDELRTTKTDPTKQLPMSATKVRIGKDWSFVFKMQADAGGNTMDNTKSALLCSMTTYDTVG